MSMYLSVIIPCHNGRKYIKRLLNSLVIQDFEDCEIIICDDNSTDNFMEIVEKYDRLLNIKYYKTQKHKLHCPGNTRLDGLSYATGEWVTFIDQDDEFLPNAFKVFYNNIECNKEHDLKMLFSPVKRIYSDGSSADLVATTWLHGNFYNRKFLLDYNINFKEDLFGNEDLYFNNMVSGIITGNGFKLVKLDTPLYNWYYNDDSLSVQKTDLDYTEKYFGDYLISNTEPHIKCMKLYPEKRLEYRNELIQALIYSYIYTQRALYNYSDKSQLKDMLNACKKVFKKIKKALGLSTDDIIDLIMINPDRLKQSFETIYTLSGKFIFTQTVSEYFKSLE